MPISHPFLVTDTNQGVIMRLGQETRMLDGIPRDPAMRCVPVEGLR